MSWSSGALISLDVWIINHECYQSRVMPLDDPSAGQARNEKPYGQYVLTQTESIILKVLEVVNVELGGRGCHCNVLHSSGKNVTETYHGPLLLQWGLPVQIAALEQRTTSLIN